MSRPKLDDCTKDTIFVVERGDGSIEHIKDSDYGSYVKDLEKYCDELEDAYISAVKKVASYSIKNEKLEEENRKLEEQNRKLFLLVNKQLEKERLASSNYTEEETEDE